MAGGHYAVVLSATSPSHHEAIGGDYCRNTGKSSHSPWAATTTAHIAKSPWSRPEAYSAAVPSAGHIGRLPLDHGCHDLNASADGVVLACRPNYLAKTVGIFFINLSMPSRQREVSGLFGCSPAKCLALRR